MADRKWSEAALAAVALALAGCNMVVTKQPVFSAADSADVRLRDGVWVGPQEDCRFDEAKPVQAWPGCAKWAVIRGREALSFDAKTRVWTSHSLDDLLLAGGDPLILQSRSEGDEGEGPSYFYSGVAIASRDDQGRITRFEAWPVLCGPPPTTPASDDQSPTRFQTRQPFAGLMLDTVDSDCTTTDKAALRAAARASRALATSPQTSHWVRDGFS